MEGGEAVVRSPLMRSGLAMLALPAALAAGACASGRVGLKVAVAGACAALLLAGPWRRSARLAAAGLGFAMVGDWLLGVGSDAPTFFMAGIGAFLCDHLCTLAWARRQGGVNRRALAALLGPYLVWFFVAAAPAIGNPALASAALVYLVVSCVTLAAASGQAMAGPHRPALAAGVALFLFSDTCIALDRFLHAAWAGPVVLPAYFAAQILITAGVMLRHRATSD